MMGSAGQALGPQDKQRQLAELRRRMAAIPAKGVEVSRRVPLGPIEARSTPAESRGTSAESRTVSAETGFASAEAGFGPAGGRSAVTGSGFAAVRSGAVDGFRRESLPVPPALVDLLPEGGLAKGSVVSYNGASSLLSGLLAAVTGAGGHAAAVGLPRLGLLAAAEMGAQLGRLAVVADPGPDPLEVASVLLDGLDLVILGLDGVTVPPSRARVLAARARSKNSTLVVTNGTWSLPTLRIDSRITGYDGLGRGCGRLRTVRLEVSVRGRSVPPRRGRLDMFPCNGRVEWSTPTRTPVETMKPAHHAVS